MKLYNLDLSPFAARCRIQIHAKGLEIPSEEPPGGLSSDEYKKINPTGKVPELELDDGTVLSESAVICEYLED
jgi:glutathione S-transferase